MKSLCEIKKKKKEGDFFFPHLKVETLGFQIHMGQLGEIPSDPVIKIQSLVRELRSHMPRGVAKKSRK